MEGGGANDQTLEDHLEKSLKAQIVQLLSTPAAKYVANVLQGMDEARQGSHEGSCKGGIVGSGVG